VCVCVPVVLWCGVCVCVCVCMCVCVCVFVCVIHFFFNIIIGNCFFLLHYFILVMNVCVRFKQTRIFMLLQNKN
jgi:hypothetical protein